MRKVKAAGSSTSGSQKVSYLDPGTMVLDLWPVSSWSPSDTADADGHVSCDYTCNTEPGQSNLLYRDAILMILLHKGNQFSRIAAGCSASIDIAWLLHFANMLSLTRQEREIGFRLLPCRQTLETASGVRYQHAATARFLPFSFPAGVRDRSGKCALLKPLKQRDSDLGHGRRQGGSHTRKPTMVGPASRPSDRTSDNDSTALWSAAFGMHSPGTPIRADLYHFALGYFGNWYQFYHGFSAGAAQSRPWADWFLQGCAAGGWIDAFQACMSHWRGIGGDSIVDLQRPMSSLPTFKGCSQPMHFAVLGHHLPMIRYLSSTYLFHHTGQQVQLAVVGGIQTEAHQDILRYLLNWLRTLLDDDAAINGQSELREYSTTTFLSTDTAQEPFPLFHAASGTRYASLQDRFCDRIQPKPSVVSERNTMELLLKCGFDPVEIHPKTGRTPLHFVRSEEAARLLLQHPLGVNCLAIPDADGLFPIHYHCKLLRRRIVEALLAHDREMINVRSLKGETPLMWAAGGEGLRTKQTESLVWYLLDRGASVLPEDDLGLNAVDYASQLSDLSGEITRALEAQLIMERKALPAAEKPTGGKEHIIEDGSVPAGTQSDERAAPPAAPLAGAILWPALDSC